MGLYYSYFMNEKTKASEIISNLLKITQLNIKLGRISIGSQALCDSKLLSVPILAESQNRFWSKDCLRTCEEETDLACQMSRELDKEDSASQLDRGLLECFWLWWPECLGVEELRTLLETFGGLCP